MELINIQAEIAHPIVCGIKDAGLVMGVRSIHDLEWKARDAAICPRDMYVSSLCATAGAKVTDSETQR